ncbi:MAG TPA: hypothetical protein VHO01_07345 [Jatrophihabitans sp.]|nr:hypothetical protein [Jatrophihabitans sp.]
MPRLLSFEYSSVHGALAAAYTSGALAAEFGPERVRVSLPADAQSRGWPAPLLAELPLAAARQLRFDTRLLGLVPDGDGPAWALLTSHVYLERESALLVRALGAVLLARPHRRPVPASEPADAGWAADGPLRAAGILVTEDFVGARATIAA